MSCNSIARFIGQSSVRSISHFTSRGNNPSVVAAVSATVCKQLAGAHTSHNRTQTPAFSGVSSSSHISSVLWPVVGSMRASALPSHSVLQGRVPIRRCSVGLFSKPRLAVFGDHLRPAGSKFHSSCKQHDQEQQRQQQQQQQGQQSGRHGTTAHAAAGSAAWDHSQHHQEQQQDSGAGVQQQAKSCGCAGTSSHNHSHSHHHHHHRSDDHHGQGHSHNHHHHHYHTDTAAASNPVLSGLSKTGLFSLADHLERHTAYTVTSVSCFIAALLLPYCVSQGLLQAATAAALGKAALAVTYMLSGIPQLVETVGAAVAGKIDTHVLMSLSVVGTLYMGMAQEGALLLLLFRVSHLLEDRLTEKAAGSLERLFDSVPDTASLVEVDEGGAPRAATTQQVPADAVGLGQHVLVRPGEQVPLDGTITWGTANLSLQHISGEAQPVRLGPGQEVPAGSLSTDGLLVIRVEATAENSTPSRIANMAAQAQAQRPQLTRWLDNVGEVWSKAVIGATLATAALLPLLGVPFLGDRGALYRAMGVLTAGSPCALALVPLAYACAIAAITAKGILIKSGGALDALAACKTIALDKTGTITTGSLNLAEGFVLHLNPADAGHGVQPAAAAASSGSSGSGGWVQMRPMEGLAELCRKITPDSSSSSSGGGSSRIGSTTNYSSSSNSSFDDDDYRHKSARGTAAAGSNGSAAAAAAADGLGFDELALKCAVALSRLSNHPVSRAMVDSAPSVDGDVAVLSFEQVPGSGVQGVCRVGDAEPIHIRFGAPDWINSYITDSNTVTELNGLMKQHTNRPSRAISVLSISQLLPVEQTEQQQQHGLAPAGVVAAAAADAAQGLGAADSDMAVILEASSSSSSSLSSTPASSSSSGSAGSRPSSPFRRISSSSSRPVSPSKFVASHGNRDGSMTFSFDFDDELHDELPAAASPVHSQQQQQQQYATLSGNSSSGSSSGSSTVVQQQHTQQQQQPSPAASFSPGSSVSGSVDVDGTYGPPGQPTELALLCFEDVIQAGVPVAVQQLQSGSWTSSRWRSSGAWLLGSGTAAAAKDVVMLTGDNARVAQAVAHAVGIKDFRSGLKPEDKLAYIKAAAAAAAAAEGSKPGSGADGLLMAGDGINDAPALAAAQVGVAIASTPKDMVAAAADIIVLNGQGITNLPWLFHVADRTHVILKQNLALALASVAVATLPTVAGMFPLWLAVTLHEGSTLLVALNSLRLLLEAPSGDHSKKGKHSHGHGSQRHHHDLSHHRH